MIKAEDIKMMEAQLNAAIDEAIASNGTKESPAVDDLMANFTGPGTGLYWDAANRKLCIAEGHCLDENGYVVDPRDVTGPATGLEYRNGRVVKANV